MRSDRLIIYKCEVIVYIKKKTKDCCKATQNFKNSTSQIMAKMKLIKIAMISLLERGTGTAKNTILGNHFFEDANNHFGRKN